MQQIIIGQSIFSSKIFYHQLIIQQQQLNYLKFLFIKRSRCYCVNRFDSLPLYNGTYCQYSCLGDNSQSCGGVPNIIASVFNCLYNFFIQASVHIIHSFYVKAYKTIGN